MVRPSGSNSDDRNKTTSHHNNRYNLCVSRMAGPLEHWGHMTKHATSKRGFASRPFPFWKEHHPSHKSVNEVLHVHEAIEAHHAELLVVQGADMSHILTHCPGGGRPLAPGMRQTLRAYAYGAAVWARRSHCMEKTTDLVVPQSLRAAQSDAMQ
jgi:hypothetical protein